MATGTKRPELIVIVGPTASGKSDLAIRLAKDLNGEIVSADSLSIYKGMNIGVAKPTKVEQQNMAHWGIDIVGPGERFTAAQFKHYAQEKIVEIRQRGKLPIVVGGTGLYIDALVFDFTFGSEADLKQRQKLEKASLQRLQDLIKQNGYEMPRNSKNRRHLIRTVERRGQAGSKLTELPPGVMMIGILPTSEELKQRIDKRAEEMFDGGLVDETKNLIKQYGAEGLAAKAKVAYGPVIKYLDGSIGMDEAKQQLKTGHWQFARRQKTWFKRNAHIKWFNSGEQAYKAVKKTILNT